MKHFTKIIGSGGFGLIVKHKSMPVVMKLLYDGNCDDSKIEFEKHYNIYSAFSLASKKLSIEYSNLASNYKEICVSRPLAFENRKIEMFDKIFACYYLMSFLNPLTLNNNSSLYHIINDEYKSTVDKSLGRVYSLPISENNPSRGFFASYSYITDVIFPSLTEDQKGVLNNIDVLIQYMGFSFGLITFVAEYFPKDVEYTLGTTDEGKLCFCVLDFGMTSKLDFNFDTPLGPRQRETQLKRIAKDLLNEFDVDIYFPTEIRQKELFLLGMKDSLKLVEKDILAKTEIFNIFSKLIMED
jgi:hypothetical protein